MLQKLQQKVVNLGLFSSSWKEVNFGGFLRNWCDVKCLCVMAFCSLCILPFTCRLDLVSNHPSSQQVGKSGSFWEDMTWRFLHCIWLTQLSAKQWSIRSLESLKLEPTLHLVHFVTTFYFSTLSTFELSTKTVNKSSETFSNLIISTITFEYNFIRFCIRYLFIGGSILNSSSELTWQKMGYLKMHRAMLDLHSVSKPTVMPYLPIQMSNGHVLRVGDKRPRLPSTLNDTTQEKPMSKCNFLKVFDTNWPTNWCLFFKFGSKFQTYWHYLLSLFLCNL